MVVHCFPTSHEAISLFNTLAPNTPTPRDTHQHALETPKYLLMDLDAPLDFETEDPLRSSTLVNNKRKKIIGLDDLLTDHYKQKRKLIEKEKKRAKAKKNYNSDEDENSKEALLSNIVNSCQNQMEDISGEEEIAEWGLQVFGDQKTPPCLVPKLEGCQLLQSFANNEVNSFVELSNEKGTEVLGFQGRKRLRFDDAVIESSRPSIGRMMKQRYRDLRVRGSPKHVHATYVMGQFLQSVSFEEGCIRVFLARDKATKFSVDQKRLLIERETFLKRIVELEKQLAIERASVVFERAMSAKLLVKLESMEEQLEDANIAMEIQKKKNFDLVEVMDTIPAPEKVFVEAFQHSLRDSFLEGLLVNGWLSKLVFATGQVEKSIATWTFNLILYSSEEELRTSACDFWCTILSYKNEGDAHAQPVIIDWFPSYSELHRALVTYGYSFNFLSTVGLVNKDSSCRGPPQNLIAWIKFTAACCQVRGKKSIFSTEEAEMLVEAVICLFLDRQLLILSVHLHQFLQSAISYFTEQEWNTSCEKIAKSLAHRVPLDLNCLRTVDCISGVNIRSKHLRSAIAYQILVHCFDNQASNEEEILNLLITINVKDRNCDLFKMYVYLVLTENWLLSCPKFEEKPVINEMWGVYLRNCSCQISSTDLRPYASKVRNKASYLLQGPINN
ncbi:hypothetical protein Patl1_30579 [Pistacia atlantica]|uniref:Uncharacterized protein n=1 Tax=Pistacia atlantica TaxID=434234 RepID=A0ACC1A9W3_9ROSI|nr:hypothetical protein Patl1_30579 [Pistacia atlantica]